MAVAAPFASMRPPPKSRGKRAWRPLCAGGDNRFNEAPAEKQGKTSPWRTPLDVWRGFNEAPAEKQGKTWEASRKNWPCCCFNEAPAEKQGKTEGCRVRLNSRSALQ